MTRVERLLHLLEESSGWKKSKEMVTLAKGRRPISCFVNNKYPGVFVHQQIFYDDKDKKRQYNITHKKSGLSILNRRISSKLKTKEKAFELVDKLISSGVNFDVDKDAVMKQKNKIEDVMRKEGLI